MTETDRQETMLEVAEAFVCACSPAPNEQELRDWQSRHPRYAEELAGFAEVMRASPAARGETVQPGPHTELDEKTLRLLDVLHSMIGTGAVEDREEHDRLGAGC